MGAENEDKIRMTSNLIVFMAIWDEEIGPYMIDIYPKLNIGIIEQLSIQIFQAYQFFWDSPDKPFSRAKMILPFKNLDKKAKIIFDVIPNPEIRGGFQPFIVVLLSPEHFSDESLELFDETMLMISKDFAQQKQVDLKIYYQNISNIFALKVIEKEEKLELDDYYSYTIAMDDFQAGIKLYHTRNFDKAYNLLKRVLKKFELENHRHLIMEVVYLIATILAQKKDFFTSFQYFSRLEDLSIELDNDKNLEISRFMKGFCAFKNEDFSEALKNLDSIDIQSSRNISKIQYLIVYGNIMKHFERLEDSLNAYLGALEQLEQSTPLEKIEIQKAHLFYEIGLLNYKIALNELKISKMNPIPINKEKFNQTLEYLNESVEILKGLNDNNFLLNVYQLTGTIFEFIGDYDNFIYFYEKAIDLTVKNKKFADRLKLTEKLVQKYDEMNKNEKNVKILQDIIQEIYSLNFIDFYTIANFHRMLGQALFKSDNKEQGITEFIQAHEIFKKFKRPVYDDLLVLTEILKYFSEIKDFQNITLYEEEINKISERLDEMSKKKPSLSSPLLIIKELWIYSTSTGVTLFSQASETPVDHDLLGGFLTAIQQFSIELSRKEFDSMIIGKDLYMVYQEPNMEFAIFGRSSSKNPPKLTKRILSIIYKRFWKEYAPSLANFKGDITPFMTFNKILESLDLTLEF